MVPSWQCPSFICTLDLTCVINNWGNKQASSMVFYGTIRERVDNNNIILRFTRCAHLNTIIKMLQ